MIYCAVLLGVILVYVGLGALTIGHMDGTLIFSNFLGMYLLICAYAVIGLFMSCLTSYQVVAAIGTLAFLSFLNFLTKKLQISYLAIKTFGPGYYLLAGFER